MLIIVTPKRSTKIIILNYHSIDLQMDTLMILNPSDCLGSPYLVAQCLPELVLYVLIGIYKNFLAKTSLIFTFILLFFVVLSSTSAHVICA